MSKRALLFVSSSALALMFALPADARPTSSSPESLDGPVPYSGPTSETTTESMPDFISGELVVDVKDNLSEDEIASLGAEYGISLEDNSPGIKDDLVNAGARWVDREAVVCHEGPNTLVSSRKPADLPAFERALLAEFARTPAHA